MTRRRRRTRKKLLDNLTGKRGHWKLKEETLDGSVCVERILEDGMDVS